MEAHIQQNLAGHVKKTHECAASLILWWHSNASRLNS